MFNIISTIENLFSYYGDPRSVNYTLLRDPWTVPALIIAYILFSTSIGPYLMKGRPPFECKTPMIIFNIIQIIANFCIFSKLLLNFGTDLLMCMKYDFTATDPKSITLIDTVWWYSLLKISDLCDTVFMVLRKKEKQISFLHVYHHAGMILLAWVAGKFFAGGPILIVGVVNSFVHTIMYSYYLLTALIDAPVYKKSLISWKRRITELQMAQFFVVGLFVSYWSLRASCTFPRLPVILFLAQDMFIITLFWDFYRNAYLKSSDKKL